MEEEEKIPDYELNDRLAGGVGGGPSSGRKRLDGHGGWSGRGREREESGQGRGRAGAGGDGRRAQGARVACRHPDPLVGCWLRWPQEYDGSPSARQSAERLRRTRERSESGSRSVRDSLTNRATPLDSARSGRAQSSEGSGLVRRRRAAIDDGPACPLPLLPSLRPSSLLDSTHPCSPHCRARAAPAGRSARSPSRRHGRPPPPPPAAHALPRPAELPPSAGVRSPTALPQRPSRCRPPPAGRRQPAQAPRPTRRPPSPRTAIWRSRGRSTRRRGKSCTCLSAPAARTSRPPVRPSHPFLPACSCLVSLAARSATRAVVLLGSALGKSSS